MKDPVLRPPAVGLAVRILAAALILAVTALQGHAQIIIDADSQYRYAQSRFDAGAFDEAVAEFNRFIYFFSADPRAAQAHFQIGMAHFHAGRYQASAAVFNRLTADYASLPHQNEAFLMLSRSHARQGMIERAMIDLRNLMALSSEADVIDRARYELGWLHVDRGQWSLADETFGRVTPGNQERFRIDALQQALAGSDAIVSKNPLTAGLLSIVPGGGQFYLKRYRDGLTALLINTGLAWAAWESFDNDQNALGGIIGFIGLGFYTGNIYSAVAGAHKFNRDQSQAFGQHLNQQWRISWSLAPGSRAGAALRLSLDF